MPTLTRQPRHLIALATIMLAMTVGHDDLYGDATEGQSCCNGKLCRHGTSCSDPCESASCQRSACCPTGAADRLWAVSTRGITSSACYVDLEQPKLAIFQLNRNGCLTRTNLDHYLAELSPSRRVVVYVHGNRMNASDAIRRGIDVYRRTRGRCKSESIDWVIWSWPSEKEGILVNDARRKFRRTDAQGLYLSWLLRKHVEANHEITLIGYSFGARVVTGSLHALAGGPLGGRKMPGEPSLGLPIRCGLVAPALERRALTESGIHSMATQNLDSMVLLYNRRDAVLKRFWLLQQVRGTMALGYSGPIRFAPRFDGSDLPVLSRDCASNVGYHHAELDYYNSPCSAGREMAALIDAILDPK